MKTRLHFPKPQRLREELSLENVDLHRKFECIFYDLCLDYATEFKYPSFSCGINCKYYYKNRESIKDMLGYSELAKEILRNKKNGENNV